MPIKAVIWDLGGVILRTEETAPRQQLADRLGMARYDLEELVFHSPSGMQAQRGEISVEQHWEKLRQELNLSQEEMPAVARGILGRRPHRYWPAGRYPQPAPTNSPRPAQQRLLGFTPGYYGVLGVW